MIPRVSGAAAIRIAVALLLALSACFADQSIARAQTPPTANVAGTVLDPSGHPVGHATVTLTGPVQLRTESAADGTYGFTGIPFGSYDLGVSASGFEHVSRAGVVVSGDLTVGIKFDEVAGNSNLKEIGRVRATGTTGATINVTPAAVSVLSAQDYRDQNATRLTPLLEQLPGVAIEHNYSAITGLAGNLFYSPNPTLLNLSLRGSLTYESAVTYDGHLLASGQAGQGPNIGALGTLGMQQIELVRGPGAQSSTINGAIGGTLNYVPIDSHGKPVVNYSVGTDGFGGSQTTYSYGGNITSRVNLDLGYSAYNTPGAQSGVTEYFAGASGEAFNGATLTRPPACPAQGCYNVFVPQGPSGTGGYSLTNNLLLCCGTLASDQNQFEEILRLGYGISPNTTLTILWAGYQSKTNNGASAGVPHVTQFIPTAGYTGSLPADTFVGSNFDYPTTDNMHQNVYEYDLKTSIGQSRLRLSYFQDLSTEVIENGNPANSASVVAYGSAWLNGSATPTIFNGTPGTLTMSPGAGDFNLTRLYDWIAQIDEPVGSSIFSLAYNHNINRSTITFYEPAPQLTGDIPGDLYRATTDSLMLRATAHPSKNLVATAAVYLNWYNYNYSTVAPSSPLFTSSFIENMTAYDAPRFGLTWTPSRRVAVRFGAGGAIAPIPVGTYETAYGGLPTPNNAGAPAYYTQSLPPQNLHAETAFGYSVGADFRLDPSQTVASLDLYRTSVFGQYLTTVTSDGTYNGLPLYASAIGNTAHSIEEGLELTLAHVVAKGIGFRLQGSLQRSYLPSVPLGFYANPATGTAYAKNLAVVPNTNLCDGFYNGGLGFGEECVPYSNGSAQVSYRFAREGLLSMTGTYYGADNSYYRPAFLRLDGALRVPLARSVALQFNAYNLNNIWSGTSPFAGYAPVAPNGSTPGTPLPLANGKLGVSPGGTMGPRTLSISVTGRF